MGKAGQKPVDQRNNQLSSLEHIWESIRAMAKEKEVFSTKEVRGKTNARQDKVSEYMRRLAKAGYLEVVSDSSIRLHALKRYRLVKDSRETPRVRKDGSLVTQGAGNESMWRTMRMLGTFSVKDLIVTSSECPQPVKESTAVTYVGALLKAGYLTMLSNGSIMLLPSMNSGPKPPQIQRTKRIWDANLKKVVWSSDGGHA